MDTLARFSLATVIAVIGCSSPAAAVVETVSGETEPAATTSATTGATTPTTTGVATTDAPPPGAETGDEPVTTSGTGTTSGDGADTTTGGGPCVPGAGPEQPIPVVPWDEGGGDGGGSFISEPGISCTVFGQDCPPGQKCMPWSNDGFAAYTGATCSPVVPDPKAVGEACVWEGSPYTGLDDCDVGLMCVADACVELCGSSGDYAVCDGDATACAQEGPLPLCMPTCNPLVESPCPPGLACLGVAQSFICITPPPVLAAKGELCGLGTTCEPGTRCSPAAWLPSCAGEHCCSPLCELGDGATCFDGQTCTALYPDGVDDRCLESIGQCAVL